MTENRPSVEAVHCRMMLIEKTLSLFHWQIIAGYVFAILFLISVIFDIPEKYQTVFLIPAVVVTVFNGIEYFLIGRELKKLEAAIFSAFGQGE